MFFLSLCSFLFLCSYIINKKERNLKMDDFRKYATKHLGMNGLMLDDVIKSQAGYLNPYILGVFTFDDGPHYFFRHSD